MTRVGTGGSDGHGEKTSDRFDLYWVEAYYDADKLPLRADEFDKFKKNYPANLQRRSGTQWVFLSREFAEYLITSMYIGSINFTI